MKRVVYFVIIMIICGVLPVYSQSSDNQSSNFSLGIIGGINIANMRFPNNQGEGAQKVTSLMRFGFGVVFDIQLTNNLSAHVEPMYLQKGCTIEEGADPANQPAGKIKSSSLEIPVLIKYAFGNNIQPYLVAGPTVGFNLSSEIEFDWTGLKFEGDIKEVTENFDFALTFGGGVQIPLKFGTIFLEGRYSFGLLNQRKTGTFNVRSGGLQFDMDTVKENDKCSNRGFQVLTGISIPL